MIFPHSHEISQKVLYIFVFLTRRTTSFYTNDDAHIFSTTYYKIVALNIFSLFWGEFTQFFGEDSKNKIMRREGHEHLLKNNFSLIFFRILTLNFFNHYKKRSHIKFEIRKTFLISKIFDISKSFWSISNPKPFLVSVNHELSFNTLFGAKFENLKMAHSDWPKIISGFCRWAFFDFAHSRDLSIVHWWW